MENTAKETRQEDSDERARTGDGEKKEVLKGKEDGLIVFKSEDELNWL